jgi:hypothetical protein
VKNVADTVGNHYRQFVAAETLGDAGSLETWGAENAAVAAAGANTVNVTFQTVCPKMNMKVVGYRGIPPTAAVDTSVSARGTATNPTPTMTVRANDIVFAHTADSYVAIGAGDGWTQILLDDWKTIAEERAAEEAGTMVVTYKPSADENWVIQALALRCK